MDWSTQASLSLTISWSLPKLISIVSVMPSSHLIWCFFSFCPRSFPASGTSPMSHLFTSDNQNTGALALASVLPMNIQGLSPLRLTGLISLLSKGHSSVFFSTTSFLRDLCRFPDGRGCSHPVMNEAGTFTSGGWCHAQGDLEPLVWWWMGLCFFLVDFLSWGNLPLETTCCLVGLIAACGRAPVN